MSSVADIAEIQRTAMSSLNQRMANFEAHLKTASSGTDLSDLQKDYSAFKEHVWNVLSMLQQQILEVSKSVDIIEMRHRRKFLLLSGVPEKPAEKVADLVTSVLHSNLGLSDFNPSTLTVCHRLGTASSGKQSRPILLRFADPEFRASVWKIKTKLKGSPFVLSEFLTRRRQSTFSVARKLFGVTNVWTLDGNVNVKLPNGNRQRVYGYEDAVALGAEHGKFLEPSDSPAEVRCTTPVQGTSQSTASPPTRVLTRSRRNIVPKK